MSSDLLFINQLSFCEEIVYFILASLYYQTTLNERTLIVLCSLFLQKKKEKQCKDCRYRRKPGCIIESL